MTQATLNPSSTDQPAAPTLEQTRCTLAEFGPEQVAAFQEFGFVIVEDALNSEEIDELNQDTLKVCRGDYGDYAGWQGPHDGQSDLEVIKQYLCIHFPHKCSPVMRKYLDHHAMVKVLTGVIGPDVKCMQSMLFVKASGKPGQAWHQDEMYIPTRDRSLTGGWIALDDATVNNGCLWVIPGSQQPGVIWPQKYTQDARFDCTGETFQFPYTEKDEIPVEVKRGTIVFFNGYLLHRSLPNRAPEGTFRRVLVNHYMSASSLLPWHRPEDGTGMAQADMRDIVMIAGQDPYTWKGIDDIAKPSVRASGEGGCGKVVNGKPEREKVAAESNGQ